MNDTPVLHVVTDDVVLARRDFEHVAADVLEAGREALALHLRGPLTSGARLFALGARLLPVARSVGARLVVNDRVDVALAAGIDAVHIGARSLPVDATRAILPDASMLGVSCHSEEDVRRAQAEGADYVFAGSVFATRSHAGRIGIGIEGLRTMVDAGPALPVIAIGGVSPAHGPELLDTGARGVAAIRGIWSVAHPAGAVAEYISALAIEHRNGGRAR